MTRFKTLLTVTVFGTMALQAAAAFAGGHSNHNGNLTRKYGTSASRQIALPKPLPIRSSIAVTTHKPKGLAGLGQPAKGGQLHDGSKGQTIAAEKDPLYGLGGMDVLHDLLAPIDWQKAADQLLKDKRLSCLRPRCLGLRNGRSLSRVELSLRLQRFDDSEPAARVPCHFHPAVQI
ncbi:MAG: hypothetical protein HY288_05955 [Planctomycetia bacterium]|nr:hypothetical protein [Planctomycetia bacterium]